MSYPEHATRDYWVAELNKRDEELAEKTELFNALINRMKQARNTAEMFFSKNAHESAEYWWNVYDVYEAVIYDLVKAKDDKWMQLADYLRDGEQA